MQQAAEHNSRPATERTKCGLVWAFWYITKYRQVLFAYLPYLCKYKQTAPRHIAIFLANKATTQKRYAK